MNKLVWLLALPMVTQANLSDSLSIRFGGGVAKPFAIQRYANPTAGTVLNREIPAMPTVVIGTGLSIHHRAWEYGLQAGVDGEVISVDRTDGTGFSLGHVGFDAAGRLLQTGRSAIWIRGSTGYAHPVWMYDEADRGDAAGGLRIAGAIEFARSDLRVGFGVSRSWVSFSDRNRQGTATSDWETIHISTTVAWDWIAAP